MKILNFNAVIGGLALFVLVASSCTVALNYPYKYGSGQSGETHNMINVQDLGVGFDLIYLDPEDLSKNSVQGRQVKPRVFEFVEDPNPYHTIDIPKLGGTEESTKRLNMVLGVDSGSSPRFDWSEEGRFVYSASKYRDDYANSYSGSVGFPGIASFSASKSFKNVQETTSESQNMYVYKDGTFRGHTIALAPGFSHKLSADFIDAVNKLGSEKSYQDFINYWGTHYSTAATLGAKCSFRIKFSKQSKGSYSENKESFKTEISGGIKQLELGFGTSNSQESIKSVQSEVGASEINFVSYGGSGAGTTDFGKWSEQATLNPTLIDVKLAPYTDLLNVNYFPRDTLINRKSQNLTLAYDNYYAQFKAIEDSIALIRKEGNHTDFFKKSDIAFEVALRYISLPKTDFDDNYIRGLLDLSLVNENYDIIKDSKGNNAQFPFFDSSKLPKGELKVIKNVPNSEYRASGIITIPDYLQDGKVYFKAIGGLERHTTFYNSLFPLMAPKSEIGVFKSNDLAQNLREMVEEEAKILTMTLTLENYSPTVEIMLSLYVTRIR